MAIIPESKYPGKITPASTEYPYGQARNITLPGDGTGTPWEAALVNDLFGFQQALLGDAGITPSGDPDDATASQYLQSIKRLFPTVVSDFAALSNIVDPVDGQRALTPDASYKYDSGEAAWVLASTQYQFLGVGDFSTFDSADPTAIFSREVEGGAGGNGHGITLEDKYLNLTGSYAGFDALIRNPVNGTNDHINSFQARSEHTGAGTTTHFRGLRLNNEVQAGTVTNFSHIDISGRQSGGTVLNEFGVTMSAIAKGDNNCFGINISSVSGPKNNYGINIGDVSGGTDNNFSLRTGDGVVQFRDKVAVGNLIPATQLDVQQQDAVDNIATFRGQAGKAVSIHNASADRAGIGITAATATDAFTFRTGTTDRMLVFGDGGLVMQGATGDSQGQGTVNAQAVYDDGVLLTDYVFDKYLGNGPSFEYSDAVTEKAGQLNPELFDPLAYGKFWKQNRRLPNMPDTNDLVDGVVKKGHGDMIQRLMEVVELQAIHIESLRERIENLGG